jgi:hypothetical protein
MTGQRRKNGEEYFGMFFYWTGNLSKLGIVLKC